MAKMRNGEVELDKKDYPLLWLLTKNCRAPLKELAKQTGLTINSVFRRIKFYEEHNVVDKWTADLTVRKMGLALVSYITIKLRSTSGKSYNELMTFLLNEQTVVELSTTMGEFDMFIVIITKDQRDFEVVTNKIRQTYKNVIDVWDSIPVLRTYKYNYVKARTD